MTLTKWRKQRLLADFDRVQFVPAANFLTLPISKSAGKLLKGATVAYVLVTLATLAIAFSLTTYRAFRRSIKREGGIRLVL